MADKPKVTIPKKFLTGFSNLVELSNDEFNSLLKALKNVEPLNFNSSIEKEFENESLHEDDFSEILMAIFSISGLQNYLDKTKEEVINLIVEDFVKQTEKEKKGEVLRKRLIKLEEASISHQIYSKALRLSMEGEHIFNNCRVYTDVRPLFEDENHNLLKNYAVVTHRLKITYEDQGLIKELFFTVTPDNLKKLQLQANRAIDKESNLRKDWGDHIHFFNL